MSSYSSCSEYMYNVLIILILLSINILAKPTDPTLTIYPEHPFVNSRVTFTCCSLVQRWPGYIPSNLSYQFFGNSRGHTEKNSFIVNNLTNSDKGRNISCQATDDRGKVSIISKNITLDPYCKY